MPARATPARRIVAGVAPVRLPRMHAPTDRIDATLRVLASEQKPITQWMPVRLHHAAEEVGARVVLLGDGPVAPGTEAFVQLVLEQPIAAAAGDRFVLRDTSAQRTIGGGMLLDLRAPARKRRTPERLAQLEAYAIADPVKALAALLDRPPGYVDFTAFCRDRALSAAECEALVTDTGLFRLATPKGDWQLPTLTMNIAYQNRDHLPAKIRVFNEFLVNHVRSTSNSQIWSA